MSKSCYFPFYDKAVPLEDRIEDLLQRLRVREKIPMMLHRSPGIRRLGIPSYNWWNEAIHGVGRAGIATVFPQPTGLAATFNPETIFAMAEIIAKEARAKHHKAVRDGDRGMYKGLTFWSPNINLYRDPRWGRGHETYGEDPWLTTRMGVSFIKGLQGSDPNILQCVATPKHFAVHSGPEKDRHSFNAEVSQKDLWESYLPAFQAAIEEAGAEGIMGAYNRVNGEPCCASPTLLEDILRKQWGFQGHVVSDCGALHDIYKYHRVVNSREEAAALALNHGCELNCGNTFKHLKKAFNNGLITEETIDRSLRRLLRARFKLGLFDQYNSKLPIPEGSQHRYTKIPYSVVACQEHRDFAVEVARQSMVLLKNRNSALPLNPEQTVAVIGPNAAEHKALLGNYNGTPKVSVSVLEAIERLSQGSVLFSPGCNLTDAIKKGAFPQGRDRYGRESISLVDHADVVILVLGLSPELEGEEGDAFNADASGDRTTLDLPKVQQELFARVSTRAKLQNKPIITVLINGGPLALGAVAERSDAIIEAWYPGGEGGLAVAEAIYGVFSPAGRLPITFVHSHTDLPPFEDYSMEGRTYRFIQKEPLYPFGFGLSYTSFSYDPVQLARKAGCTLDSSSQESVTTLRLSELKNYQCCTTITNTGSRLGRECVQLYIEQLSTAEAKRSPKSPRWSLRGVQSVLLKPGESTTVEFSLAEDDFTHISEKDKSLFTPGLYTVYIGGVQPDNQSQQLAGKSTEVVKLVVSVKT